MNSRKLMAISIVLTFLFTFNSPLTPAHAGQHLWGASYIDWSGARLDATSSVSQVIQPLEVSPKIYWEAGWNWDNLPNGGYGGIQTQGISPNGQLADIAIFSIWDTGVAVAAPGAGCLSFGGEGTGMSCRVKINLVESHKYQFTFSQDGQRGPEWWMAKVVDLNSVVTYEIGSIKVSSKTAAASNWNNFIEYWGDAVSCNSVGRASARFYLPLSTNPKINFHSPAFSRPKEACVNSAADLPPAGKSGDAILRFGGSYQAPSTRSLPIYEQNPLGVPTKKTTTITCLKGKLIKKITAVNPKCPVGYKKK